MIITAKNPVLREILDWALHIGIAVAIGLLIVNFVVQITIVNGLSMVPTLHHADKLLVEKISPRMEGKIQRGDIVTVNVPEFLEDGKETIIKRVIGLEGDTVEIKNDGKVYVNNELLKEDYISGSFTNVFEPKYSKVTVPKGSLFVMGDNRLNSKDSRIIGPVDKKKVSGKVLVRILPLNKMGKVK
ncbi:MAG: signal peptidase I [Clostridia bacterium]|nr:signal peptidase I [Clostridia bacterium]